MRVAVAGLLVREREVAGPRMVVRDIGGAVVLGRVMVREPVAHLRKEESESHEQGREGAPKARAAHVPHDRRITQREGACGSQAARMKAPPE